MKIGEVLGVGRRIGARRRSRRHGAAAAPAAQPAAGCRAAALAAGRRRAADDADAPRRPPSAWPKEHDVDLGAVQGSGAGGRVTKQDVQARDRRQPQAPAPRSRRAPVAPPAPAPSPAAGRADAAPAGDRGEDARAHDQAPRDDRAAARRGAAHRGDAHDLQRGRHDGRHGAARAPQGSVQEAARRRPRHRVVLRQGERRRAHARSRSSTPRSRATRSC